MSETSLLTRTLMPGSVGKDVEAIKRAVYRSLNNGKLKTLAEKPTAVRRTFGPFFLLDVYAIRRKLGFVRKPGVDEAVWHTLVRQGAPDALSYSLLNQYIEEQKPKPTKLVEPNQGFRSLNRSLWEVYSIGRNMGLSDLGTYNPSSRLPGSGLPSDHAVYPAMAFDLGIEPDTGWHNLKARAYVIRIVGRKEVEYVILGDRIWTRRGFGKYYSGGHMNHCHVSGNR